MPDLRHTMMMHQAVSLCGQGDLAAAEALCRQVIEQDKRNLTALQVLASIAFNRGDYAEAAQWTGKCVTLDSRNSEHHCNLATALAAQGAVEKAIAQYDKALKLKGNTTVAAAGKAGLLERLGDRDKARALLEPFIKAAKESADMAIVWAKLEHDAGRLEDAIATAARHADCASAPGNLRRQLHFEIGRASEKLGKIDEAFAAYSRGNQMTKVEFDPDEFARGIDQLMGVFTRTNLARLPRAKLDAQAAVFIVGMPRCGSTLVEQIIDAHPDAAGIGESHALAELASNLMFELSSQLPWPECIGDVKQDAADRLGRMHLDHITRLGGGKRRIVDKLLSNFMRLGLIQILLPGARIIHCMRDPLDTCFSCFVQNLSTRQHPYASDLRHLGLVYRQYERLMDHARQELDLSMIEVVYEELVADQERGTRAIIEFCGLPWDDRCLRFHESGRVVMTLSYDQVRRPIYKSSVRRCDKFAAHLGPLREGLGIRT